VSWIPRRSDEENVPNEDALKLFVDKKVLASARINQQY
jgi:hypothetical protein